MADDALPDMGTSIEVFANDYRTPEEFIRATQLQGQQLAARVFSIGQSGWLEYEHDPKRNVTRISARRG